MSNRRRERTWTTDVGHHVGSGEEAERKGERGGHEGGEEGDAEGLGELVEIEDHARPGFGIGGDHQADDPAEIDEAIGEEVHAEAELDQAEDEESGQGDPD